MRVILTSLVVLRVNLVLKNNHIAPYTKNLSCGSLEAYVGPAEAPRRPLSINSLN